MTPDRQTTTMRPDPGADVTAEATVDAVIVAYNSRDVLRTAVQPLAGLPWVNVTVVDNASPDDSAAAVADLPVRIIRAPRNGGFAYGCNIGLSAGAAEFVLLLNPDARIGCESLKSLVHALQADPALGGVGPRTYGAGGRLLCTQHRFPSLRSTYSQALGLHHLAPGASWAGEVITDPSVYRRSATPDWVSGGCLLLRRTAVEEAGGLDEGFFLYSEETDLFRRLRGRGWQAGYEPSAIAYHQCNGSAPRDATARILAQSRVRYQRKHHGPRASLLEAIGVAIDGVVRAAVWSHRPARRRGYLAAARAGLSAVRTSADTR